MHLLRSEEAHWLTKVPKVWNKESSSYAAAAVEIYRLKCIRNKPVAFSKHLSISHLFAEEKYEDWAEVDIVGYI